MNLIKNTTSFTLGNALTHGWVRVTAVTVIGLTIILISVFVTSSHRHTLTNDNAKDLIGCRLSLHSASGITNEMGRAERFAPGKNGPDVYVEFGWFDALGHKLSHRTDIRLKPDWVPASVITGYTCDEGKTWIRFDKP